MTTAIREVLKNRSWSDRAQYDTEMREYVDALKKYRGRGERPQLGPMATEIREAAKEQIAHQNSQLRTDRDQSWQRYVEKQTEERLREEKLHPVDKRVNGKFDWSVAALNFGKGLISPITGMFADVPTFFKSAAIAGGLIGLGIAIPPLGAAMATVFGFYSLISLGVACYKASSAKNGDVAEQAFTGIGSSTAGVALSLVGLRAAAGANAAPGVSRSKAMLDAANRLPYVFKDSWEVIRSGQIISNIAAAIPSSIKAKFNVSKPDGAAPAARFDSPEFSRTIDPGTFKCVKDTDVIFRNNPKDLASNVTPIRHFRGADGSNLVVLEQSSRSAGTLPSRGSALETCVQEALDMLRLPRQRTSVFLHLPEETAGPNIFEVRLLNTSTTRPRAEILHIKDDLLAPLVALFKRS